MSKLFGEDLENKMTDNASVTKGSDVLVDVCCSTCQDDEIHTEAGFYCQLCTQFYCDQCLILHNQLFKKHTTYGKGEQNKWPVSKATEDFLEKCEEHADRKIELFCEDHGQLCCVTCVLLNHRQCTKVTIITDSVKTRPNVNLQELSATITSILKQLTDIQNIQKSNSQYLQANYNDRLQEIRNMRNKINLALDKLTNATQKEMDTVRNQVKVSLKAYADNCIKIHDELKQLKDMIPDVEKKSSHLAFVAYQKGQDKIKESERYLKDYSSQKFILKFHANTEILQYLSQLPGLGTLWVEMNPDRKINISKKKTNCSVNIPEEDKTNCGISHIYCLLDNQILVADSANHSLKLLDQNFRLVNHCSTLRYIIDVCLIGSCQVAVVQNVNGIHTIQMFTVDTGKLIMGASHQLKHDCSGIAHHQGILYVTSDASLYQYTMTGTRVRRLYEHRTDRRTDKRTGGCKCAVDLGGDKLYMTIPCNDMLITLSMDGTVLSTFTDSELQFPWGLHVTPAGQILLCGCNSRTIIQVDGEGKKKIATLLTHKDGMCQPWSVGCYKNDTLIVGQSNNNYILLFDVK